MRAHRHSRAGLGAAGLHRDSTGSTRCVGVDSFVKRHSRGRWLQCVLGEVNPPVASRYAHCNGTVATVREIFRERDPALAFLIVGGAARPRRGTPSCWYALRRCGLVSEEARCAAVVGRKRSASLRVSCAIKDALHYLLKAHANTKRHNPLGDKYELTTHECGLWGAGAVRAGSCGSVCFTVGAAATLDSSALPRAIPR